MGCVDGNFLRFVMQKMFDRSRQNPMGSVVVHEVYKPSSAAIKSALHSFSHDLIPVPFAIAFNCRIVISE